MDLFIEKIALLASFATVVNAILHVIFVLSAIFLILVILLQEGKGGGFGDVFGGAGSEAFGPRVGGVNKFTASIAAFFIVSLIGIHLIQRPPSPKEPEPLDESVMTGSTDDIINPGPNMPSPFPGSGMGNPAGGNPGGMGPDGMGTTEPTPTPGELTRKTLGNFIPMTGLPETGIPETGLPESGLPGTGQGSTAAGATPSWDDPSWGLNEDERRIVDAPTPVETEPGEESADPDAEKGGDSSGDEGDREGQ